MIKPWNIVFPKLVIRQYSFYENFLFRPDNKITILGNLTLLCIFGVAAASGNNKHGFNQVLISHSQIAHKTSYPQQLHLCYCLFFNRDTLSH